MTNLNEWTMPDSYFGAEWEGYYVFLGQNRDSDVLERSNFITALELIGGESEHEGGVTVVRESHWAVGWIEWIAIPAGPSVALAEAIEILERLEACSVLNEDHLIELEAEEADKVWSKCYDRSERVKYIRDNQDQFDFCSWSHMRAVIEGKYFSGYASELIY